MTQTLSTQDVLSYLSENADFFVNNETILTKLTLPNEDTGADVNFHAFQVKQLKQKLERLELQNKRLTQVAMDNAESQQQINNLSVSLLQCDSFEELSAMLDTQLKSTFNLDSVVLSTDKDIDGITKSVTLRQSENACLHEANGVCIRSEAIIQLQTPHNKNVGYLTLGSMSSQRFHEGQGDDLLQYLGKIVGYCVNKVSA